MLRDVRGHALPWLAVLLAGAAACGSPRERSAGGSATSRAAATATLPGGTAIGVQLDLPLPGALVASPPGGVAAAGKASVGGGSGGTAAATALVVVIDVSRLTDGVCGTKTVLQCELDAALALRQQAAANGTVKEMGVVLMGGGNEAMALDALPADLGPETGMQTMVAPAADAGGAPGPDVAEVIGSITAGAAGGGAALFTDVTVVNSTTDVVTGVEAARTLLGGSSQPRKILALYAANPSMYGPSVTSLGSLADVLVRVFAFGGTACGDFLSRGSLQDVADRGAAGSRCDEVAGDAPLPDILPAGGGATLSAVTVAVDGGAGVPAVVASALPLAGPAEATFGLALTGLLPGLHELCATAAGSDGGGAGSVSACAGVRVASIALAPAAAVLELGPGAHHLVTATVTAGSAGAVAGVPVTVSVVSGPNAGAGVTAATATDGTVVLDYPARQGPSGLGTDALRACFKDDAGVEACADATAKWQDTTPPAVACVPGPNPAGKVPSCGEGNWRPDGFFRLLAVDAVDPAPRIFVVDSGTGTVFGPYPSGTAIKYTQAPGGKPRAASIGGPGSAVAWHITGKGDASVYAVDASGNRSDAVACLVPPKGPPGSGGDDDRGKGDDDGHGRKGDDDGHGHKDRRGDGDGRGDDDGHGRS